MKQHINFDDLLDSGVQPMKNRLARTRTHRVLFDADLPFRGRAEPLKTRYNRRVKHALRRDYNDE